MTTDLLAGPAPASGPAARTPAPAQRPRRSRRRTVAPWIVLAVLVVLAIAGAIIASPRGGSPLDPRSPTPEGSRAIAQLLRDRGVTVDRVRSMADVQPARGGESATIVVPFPARLGPADLARLADHDGNVVLIAPEQDVLDALSLPLLESGDVRERTRGPGCRLPAAVTAGPARTGGLTYATDGSSAGRTAAACYQDSVLTVPVGGRVITVLGTGSPLTNERLGQEGNAALALGLLDPPAAGTRTPASSRAITWVLPTGAEPGASGDETSQDGGSVLIDHLPRGLRVAIWQLLLAVLLLALARGRRLGPPVAEALPVSVRAAETVEGRARLYRAARARGTAADALREGARQRIATRLGVPSGEPMSLVTATAARTGRDPAELASLLYGPDERSSRSLDDAALVRLADELTTLDLQVRRT